MARQERKDHPESLESKAHPDLWVPEENVVKKVLQENKDLPDWEVALETKDLLDLLEPWDQLEHQAYLVLLAKLDLWDLLAREENVAVPDHLELSALLE